MRSIRSYNIRKTTTDRLNATVPRGYRSEFVDKAIQARCNGAEAYGAGDLDTRRICVMLLHRMRLRQDPGAKALVALLETELDI